MTIEFTYKNNEYRITNVELQPPEPTVRYYKDGSGYPGAPAEITNYDLIEILDGDKWIEYSDEWDDDFYLFILGVAEDAYCEELC